MTMLSCGILTISAFSQSIALDYFSTGTGNNITASYAFNLKNMAIGAGIGYHINSVAHPDDQSNIFFKRFYATEPMHHLNLNVYCHRYILPGLKHINPYLFLDFQGKHGPAKNNEQPTSSGIRHYHGPYYWIDNALGFGFDVSIAGNWYLRQKAGLGGHVILQSGQEAERVTQSALYHRATWEFTGLLNIGIMYTIGGS